MPNILEKIYQTLLALLALPALPNRFHKPDLKKLPEYGHLFFEHLQAEYTTQALEVTNDKEKELLQEIVGRGKSGSLSWKDVYTFDLIIARTLKGEKLRNKIKTLRSLDLGFHCRVCGKTGS